MSVTLIWHMESWDRVREINEQIWAMCHIGCSIKSQQKSTATIELEQKLHEIFEFKYKLESSQRKTKFLLWLCDDVIATLFFQFLLYSRLASRTREESRTEWYKKNL